ncbi:CbtB domain-containing protein [Gemmobacter serpentinus]|uniref:CbtB domain-containing protein n=1 Tax=Gemmobacter serpentinus TaxID=2652247 RepID=UPI00124C797C|nr:CbtB domain-containing protein [Gemmobacter serpentinus]
MTTATRAAGTASVSYGNIAIVALIGAILIFTAGLAQSEALHDAAHDVRHATGFPCH